VLQFLQERITKELELRPLGNALEAMSLEVTETAPFLNAQRDFFSKVEEEKDAWSALVARLRERLGEHSSLLAAPAPRLLPEAAWKKSLEPGQAELMPKVPERPLRLLRKPLPLDRQGNGLRCREKFWRLLSFEGPERLEGEWWLGGFAREYFRVDTHSGEALWVFRESSEPNGALFLHGIYD
jgi:protein ImuB